MLLSEAVSALQIGTRLPSPSPTWLRACSPNVSGWEAGRLATQFGLQDGITAPFQPTNRGWRTAQFFPKGSVESNSRSALVPENGHGYSRRSTRGRSGPRAKCPQQRGMTPTTTCLKPAGWEPRKPTQSEWSFASGTPGGEPRAPTRFLKSECKTGIPRTKAVNQLTFVRIKLGHLHSHHSSIGNHNSQALPECKTGLSGGTICGGKSGASANQKTPFGVRVRMEECR